MDNYIDKINKDNIDYDVKDSKAARSVDGDTSHVQEANEIYTTTSQSQTDAFSFRTAAGAMSINSGTATISTIYGNTAQTGHTDEVLSATGNFQTEGTTVALNKATWRAQSLENGNYTFVYDGTNWKLEDAAVTLATYGLSVSGTVADGDSIVVSYTALVIGTLATATPTAFKATGFNQYNATAGYAKVVGGNQYRVAGTYTAVEFSTTPTGTKTPVTVENNKFTPEEDGYIFVTGSGNILVALVWSGTMDSEPWSAYSDNGFNVPTTDADGAQLPTATYGFPSVHGVRDEIDFAGKLYQQRIGHYAYSAQNLATVEALGVDYIYDLSDIFYVLPDLVVYELASAVSGVYEVNDYGTEEWTGTNVPITTVITYGNSLVDKLRNLADIQTIGEGLSLGTNGELSVAGGGGGGDVSFTDLFADGSTQTKVKLGAGAVSNGARNIAIGNGASSGAGNNPTDTISIGTDAIVSGNQYSPRNSGIAIGKWTQAWAEYSMHLGGQSGNSGGIKNVNSDNSIAIGRDSTVGSVSSSVTNAIALGSYSKANAKGEMNIGTPENTSAGYNNTAYRLLTGVHDGINAHDAATVNQLNTLIDSINTAMSTNIPHIGNS